MISSILERWYQLLERLHCHLDCKMDSSETDHQTEGLWLLNLYMASYGLHSEAPQWPSKLYYDQVLLIWMNTYNYKTDTISLSLFRLKFCRCVAVVSIWSPLALCWRSIKWHCQSSYWLKWGLVWIANMTHSSKDRRPLRGFSFQL